MKLAYEVHLRVRNVRPREYALRENSVALVPSNETFNNFPRQESDIPSLLRREYSTCGVPTQDYEVSSFCRLILLC